MTCPKSAIAVLAASLTAVHCGVNKTGAGSGAIDQACPLDAQSYCNKRQSCWQPLGVNDPRFLTSFGTLDGCVQQRMRTCQADLGRASTGLSAARTTSCAMALDAQSCADFVAGVGLPTSACPPVVGTLDNAVVCAVSNQCRSNYCDRPSDEPCGRCADKQGIGKPCDQSADCATGLACLTDAVTSAMTCGMAQPKPRAGEPCGTIMNPTTMMSMTVDCDTGFACVGTGTMKTCKAQVATAGMPCDANRKTLPDCDPAANLACNKTTSLCEPRKFVDDGQACNDLADGSTAVCKAGSSCAHPLDPATGKRSAMGTCVAPGGEGQRCYSNGADGPHCAVPFRCVYDVANGPVGTCMQQQLGMCTRPAAPGPDGAATD